ncbi:DUF47 family protein [Halopenitus sp. POP-27]|uniref:DUF47 domain-containing protein n=1 Tax=Halopenitus sp. POP-27 TaxID=2994425 RepID=UPI0024687ACC|nr:DUF47 family protein [Halopenitus sp. POP-27]
MAVQPEPRFDDRIVSRTGTYLDRIDECVRLLSDLLAAYIDGGADDPTVRDLVDTITSRESDCDRLKRDISAQITNADARDIGLRNARIHLNSPRVVDLYQRLDAIPNAVEQLAEELVTIKPPREAATFDRFAEMARCAERAMDALADAVACYVRLLRSPSRSDSIAAEIATVRGAESAVDELRNDVIGTVFADDAIGRPFVYRTVALRFDEVLDAMEDVTDTLVLISSTESWITTEPDDQR